MERRKGKHHLLFFLSSMVLCVHVHSQKGFISIDCGYDGTSYKDTFTGLTYTDDSQFIDSGKNYAFSSNPYSPQYGALRSFPENTRNCHKLSPVRKRGKYLIRVGFYYGNYDGEGSVPVFDVHVGVNFWATIEMGSSGAVKENITISTGERIDVFLINTGKHIQHIQAGDIKNIFDPRVRGDFDMNLAWKIIEVAMSCRSSNLEERTTMSNVVVLLKQCVEMVET